MLLKTFDNKARFLSCGLCICLLSQIGTAQDQLAEFPLAIRRANEVKANAERRGKCRGSLLLEFKDFDDNQIETLVACDFELVFSQEKFRFDRWYEASVVGEDHILGSWGVSPGCTRRVVICNSNENYAVTFKNDKFEALKLNKDWCSLLMSCPDSPARNPLNAWTRVDDFVFYEGVDWRTSRSKNEEIVAIGRKPGFMIWCFCSPSFSLRRMEVKAGDGMKSFRATADVTWKTIGGVEYVTRFLKRTILSNGKKERHSALTIEYTDFDMQAQIGDDVFHVTSLPVKQGAEFFVNAPIPKTLIFDDKQLVEAKSLDEDSR